ncbi:AAA family ATPase [Rhizobium sp. YS-1r]|uniref:AAA family ATPase n=1 Tax=Rhizobium sp. YS-1r TaxID=1532558 RepID=UPI00068A6E31|nr:AAA family ATPase [Rhizobium sp. YS-1r]
MENRSHLPDPLRRIVIMGNGGAGKTWLAKRMAVRIGMEAVHLDDVYWQPGRYGIARDKSVVIQEVKKRADDDVWLMEGVYGWLVDVLLPRATQLIWIDLCEEECVANIRARGIQGGESEESFEGLVRWVSEYRARKNNWNSFDGHLKLYDGFSGVKVRLKSRDEIAAYVRDVSRT